MGDMPICGRCGRSGVVTYGGLCGPCWDIEDREAATVLPDTARDLLARAGLDLTTFDIETAFARIEATHEEVRA